MFSTTVPNSENVYTFLCFCSFQMLASLILICFLALVVSSVQFHLLPYQITLITHLCCLPRIITLIHQKSPLHHQVSTVQCCTSLGNRFRGIASKLCYCLHVHCLSFQMPPQIFVVYFFYPVLSLQVQLLFEKNCGFLFFFTRLKQALNCVWNLSRLELQKVQCCCKLQYCMYHQKLACTVSEVMCALFQRTWLSHDTFYMTQ